MKRVLLVDDDPDILDGVAEILEVDYEVSAAENGVEALKLLQDGHFDAVVLDLMMPVLDGAGVMAALQERGLQVPILLVSAGRELAQQCERFGVAECLAKPFDIGELEARLARVIEKGASGAPPGGGSNGSGIRTDARDMPVGSEGRAPHSWPRLGFSPGAAPFPPWAAAPRAGAAPLSAGSGA
jgi:DNA-binding response OmpR family regulator